MRRPRIIPPDIERSEQIKAKIRLAHEDVDNKELAKEHYGAYLLVKNTKKDDPHDYHRLYFSETKLIEFLNICEKTKNKTYNATKGEYQVFDYYPEHDTLIRSLMVTFPEFTIREKVRRIFLGLKLAIELFESKDITIPKAINEFSRKHHIVIQNAILSGELIVSHIVSLRKLWMHIRNVVGNESLSVLPSEPSPEVQLMNMTEDDDMLLEEYDDNSIDNDVLLQLDFYAGVELDRIISRRKEYLAWMRELDEINKNGGLFSQANLLKSYYNNTSWKDIRRYYIQKFGEDPIKWLIKNPNVKKINGQKVRVGMNYPNKEAQKRHQELLAIAEDGIDLSIQNEKMFSWWQATLIPDYPYKKKILHEYTSLVSNAKNFEANSLNHKLGLSTLDYRDRVTVSRRVLYPLYLRMLIRYKINLEPLSNAEVYLKDGKYELGGELFDARFIGITTIKTRSNAKIPIVVQKNSYEDKTIDFYLDWMQAIFERTNSNKFFQYCSDLNNIMILNAKTISQMEHGMKNPFFFLQKYSVFRHIETLEEDGETKFIPERITWFQHSKIRGASNYAQYIREYDDYIRARMLNHKGKNTERINYRNANFKWSTGVQLGLTQAIVIDHVTDVIRNERLEEFFQMPMNVCADNQSPDYNNAPKIKDDEMCTAWWHCLLCKQAKVAPNINGPFVMAFKMILKELRKNSLRDQDWEKEYSVPYQAVKNVLKQFTKEEVDYCMKNYQKSMMFIRCQMLLRQPKMKKIGL